MNPRLKLWIQVGLIAVVTVLAVLVDIPQGPNLFGRVLTVHEGLDLKGGTQLQYEVEYGNLAQTDRGQALSSLVNVIDRRVNSLGVTEPVIQTSKIQGNDSVLVELPGIQDVSQATGLIGKTAQLVFYKEGTNPATGTNDPLSGFVATDLTGAKLKSSDVTFQDQSGGSSKLANTPVVQLQFNSEGADMFQKLTAENVNKRIAIVLDGQILTAPTVQQEISGGTAVITGSFTLDEAKNLSRLLNAGALPVPIKLIAQQTIGPTLGKESIHRSLVAGVIGFLAIALFMLLNYRLRGLFALLALGIYTAIVLALFKLIPVTLTLAGIAGFILSVGMAIDANILIFERMREEERAGHTAAAALEQGFKRAWSSVRDSNLSSLLTAAILIWLGSGIVRGFALTLSIGILVSMFTAVTVTHTLLRVLVQPRGAKR